MLDNNPYLAYEAMRKVKEKRALLVAGSPNGGMGKLWNEGLSKASFDTYRALPLSHLNGMVGLRGVYKRVA